MTMGEARDDPRSVERALLWPVMIPNSARIGEFLCFPSMAVGGVTAAASPYASTRISSVPPTAAPSSLWMQRFAGFLTILASARWRPDGLCWPAWIPLAATLAWPSSISVLHPLQGEQLSELLVCKSMEKSVELQVIPNLHMRKGYSLRARHVPCFSAFLGLTEHHARQSSEIVAANAKEMLGAKMEALEENLKDMMISIRWYAELNFHHVLILEITVFSLQPLEFAAQSWKLKKWNNLLCVNMGRQANIIAEALLDYFVHTQVRFMGSKRFGCACMLTRSSFDGIATVSKEQVFPACFCGTRSTLMVGSTGEDTVPLLFGLCHRRLTTAPSLLILRFNTGDSSSLSSMKAIQHLQLNTYKP